MALSKNELRALDAIRRAAVDNTMLMNYPRVFVRAGSGLDSTSVQPGKVFFTNENITDKETHMGTLTTNKSKTWTTGNGRELDIRDMSEEHVTDTIAYLQRKRSSLVDALEAGGIALDERRKVRKGSDRVWAAVEKIDAAIADFIKELGRRA